jgi:hypothetical protein
MGTWNVHWTMDGYTPVEAADARSVQAVFDEMSSMDIRTEGDYERPQAYYIEEDPEDDHPNVMGDHRPVTVVHLPADPAQDVSAHG